MASKFVFNVFTGTFDLINDGASIPTYATESLLPLTANDGSLAIVQATDLTYVFNLVSAKWLKTSTVVEAVSSVSDSSVITTGVRTTGNINQPSLTVHVADGSNPGVLSTVVQNIAGSKTFFDPIIVQQGLDGEATPGSILDIGTVNAEVITIGNVGATVIIQGTTEYQNVTNLNVSDKLITINDNGSVSTGGNAGLEIEEANAITGFAKTSVDRNSWTLKAPNTAGIATVTPGASGITLDQSSHNPVTIGTSNGLSLSTQQLSMALSNDTTTGTLSGTDHLRYSTSATMTEAAVPFQTNNTLAKRNASGSLSVFSLFDASGTDSVAVESRQLKDAANVPQLSWTTGGIYLPPLASDRALVLSAPGIVSSSVTTVSELSYVSGVTSPIQAQLTNKADRNANDISLSSTSVSNNQVSVANVSGLLFSNASVRSAQVQYSVTIATTGSYLYEEGTLRLVQRASDWTVSRTFDGDDSLVNIDVTNAGQVTYTSSNYTGFVSGTLKFRATVTTI